MTCLSHSFSLCFGKYCCICHLQKNVLWHYQSKRSAKSGSGQKPFALALASGRRGYSPRPSSSSMRKLHSHWLPFCPFKNQVLYDEHISSAVSLFVWESYMQLEALSLRLFFYNIATQKPGKKKQNITSLLKVNSSVLSLSERTVLNFFNGSVQG